MKTETWLQMLSVIEAAIIPFGVVWFGAKVNRQISQPTQAPPSQEPSVNSARTSWGNRSIVASIFDRTTVALFGLSLALLVVTLICMMLLRGPLTRWSVLTISLLTASILFDVGCALAGVLFGRIIRIVESLVERRGEPARPFQPR